MTSTTPGIEASAGDDDTWVESASAMCVAVLPRAAEAASVADNPDVSASASALETAATTGSVGVAIVNANASAAEDCSVQMTSSKPLPRPAVVISELFRD